MKNKQICWLITIATLLFTVVQNAYSQTTSPPANAPKITITVANNATIQIGLLAAAANTPAWVETTPGAYAGITVGTDEDSAYANYTATGTIINVYGNINKLICRQGYSAVKGIDASGSNVLEILECDFNEITSLLVSSSGAIKDIICNGNELNACALDVLYASLPDRPESSKGRLVIKDLNSTNPGAPTSTTTLATAKNWEVLETISDNAGNISHINFVGDGSGCSDTPPAGTPKITLTVTENAAINLTLKADSKHHMPAWIENPAGTYERVTVGTSGSNLDITAVGTSIQIYGKIKELVVSGQTGLTGINASQNDSLKILKCTNNALTSLLVSSGGNIRQIECAANQLDACALDALYISLPDRTGQDGGILKVKNGSDTNPGAATSKTFITGNKNWSVKDGDTAFTGDGTGCNTMPYENAPKITFTVTDNASIQFGLRAATADTHAWIETAPEVYEHITMGTALQSFPA